ncbi:MAG TPA: hypothetical protein VD994_16485 [Prosthecobacter sp.]|nr:hypothetical protein [Prosthecobacter sp.]
MSLLDQPLITADSIATREGGVASDRMFFAIASRIEEDPSLLAIPQENIRRWLENGHGSAQRLSNWQRAIEDALATPEGLERLLDLLRSPSAEAARWRGFSPFAGILSPDEVRALACNSAH